MGVSFATVNRWEGGGNKPQRAAQETILALAREAGVEGAQNPPPQGVPVRFRPRAPSRNLPYIQRLGRWSSPSPEPGDFSRVVVRYSFGTVMRREPHF
ncbi:hypothetical protein [Metapseudomonas otitidis]|uniref:hypothetical protein n=1 Tax=Metapseudomonas otitidis TaxID=319939 RepID=UPI001F3B4014|nr:hypothetical protein [Pseudomonas otitidis]